MLYLLQRCIEMITQILEQVRAIKLNIIAARSICHLYL